MSGGASRVGGMGWWGFLSPLGGWKASKVSRRQLCCTDLCRRLLTVQAPARPRSVHHAVASCCPASVPLPPPRRRLRARVPLPGGGQADRAGAQDAGRRGRGRGRGRGGAGLIWAEVGGDGVVQGESLQGVPLLCHSQQRSCTHPCWHIVAALTQLSSNACRWTACRAPWPPSRAACWWGWTTTCGSTTWVRVAGREVVSQRLCLPSCTNRCPCVIPHVWHSRPTRPAALLTLTLPTPLTYRQEAAAAQVRVPAAAHAGGHAGHHRQPHLRGRWPGVDAVHAVRGPGRDGGSCCPSLLERTWLSTRRLPCNRALWWHHAQLPTPFALTHPPRRYKKSDNSFYVFADDIVPRHITAALHLDYDTVAGADRFGNVFVSRLPPEISAQVGAGADWLNDQGVGWWRAATWGLQARLGIFIPHPAAVTQASHLFSLLPHTA